jgi:TPR repeat protein
MMKAKPGSKGFQKLNRFKEMMMKQHLILPWGIVYAVLGGGMIACTPSAVQTPAPEPAQSSMQAAKDAYQRKDYKLAVEWFRKAAEQGDAKAQYNLGIAYDKGQGVAQDYAKAAQWYRKAADQGLTQAQNNLGILYKQGQGVPQDYAQAAGWFRLAAGLGFAQAQHNLGLAYRDGQGVKQDRGQALQWLQKAAGQGDEQAQADLNQLKTTGKGASKTQGAVKPAQAPKKAAKPNPAKQTGDSPR